MACSGSEEYNIIVNDKSSSLGPEIRRQRRARGMTLAELARRAGTSAPTVHRYESGWDRFEVATLRRLAAALDARLEIRLVPTRATAPRRPARGDLVRDWAPLFWNHRLRIRDLDRHPTFVLERVLTSGTLEQVRAARAFFGDDAIRKAVARRGVDARTREYWRLVLGGTSRASQGSAR